MSVGAIPAAPRVRPRWVLRSSGATALYRLPIYAACTLLALAITYALGRDLPWDTFNYHIYAGFSALHDRFAQDYFAAGPQAYLNPYAYAPFFLLIESGLSALAVGTVLAICHSIILWLTFELAVAVCPQAATGTRATVGLFAVVLTLTNPILLQQVGSSFADITTAEMALAAWVLLAKAVLRPRGALIVWSAILLGAATALKLTNAVHAISGGMLLLLLPSTGRQRLRYGLGYLSVLGLAFAIVAAPWAYRLHATFGNPFFPLFNDIFRSPEFTSEPVHLLRFVPATLGEALWRPFATIAPEPMVHDELRAPDARYALLAAIVLALLMAQLWRHFARASLRHDSRSVNRHAVTDARVVLALGCGFATDWVLWQLSSANSRYFLPMASVASVLIVVLLTRVFAVRSKAWFGILLAFTAIQVTQIAMNPGVRWNSAPWDSGPWLAVSVPEKLSSVPHLYLTMGAMSNSYLAPYVANASGFVNFTGSYALNPAGADGDRVKGLIARNKDRLRVLAAGDRLYRDLKHLPNVSDVDGALARFGLHVDPDDCVTIRVDSSRQERDRYVNYLVTCAAVAAADTPTQSEAGRDAQLILDRLEDACPALFQPRRPLLEYRNHRWQRVYLNTDIWAWVSRGYVKFYNPVNGDGPIFVGSEKEWLAAPLHVTCGRREGHAFAALVPGPSRDGTK
jgi:hypothetical protein